MGYSTQMQLPTCTAAPFMCFSDVWFTFTKTKYTWARNTVSVWFIRPAHMFWGMSVAKHPFYSDFVITTHNHEHEWRVYTHTHTYKCTGLINRNITLSYDTNRISIIHIYFLEHAFIYIYEVLYITDRNLHICER